MMEKKRFGLTRDVNILILTLHRNFKNFHPKKETFKEIFPVFPKKKQKTTRPRKGLNSKGKQKLRSIQTSNL